MLEPSHTRAYSKDGMHNLLETWCRGSSCGAPGQNCVQGNSHQQAVAEKHNIHHHVLLNQTQMDLL
jgi:hypothetical protein